MKRLIRDEKGQAMVLAVVLLLVGGLIVSSLLSYMGHGLLNGRVYEKRTAELYAADSGVEDAIWKIQYGEVALCPNQSTNYTISDVNGKSVAVNVTAVSGEGTVTLIYHVVSIATATNSGTKIDAYIAGESMYGNYSGITENVITSQYEIIYKPGSNVTPPEGEEHGPAENYTGAWPTAQVLCDWYGEDVAGNESYDSDTIDLNGNNMTLGPLYRDGELEILNSSNTPATLTLTGTIYITGDTLIGTNGKDNLTLDLNGQTIFIASNSTDPKKALWMGGKCTLVGEGVIIAVGDIYFEPKTEAGVTDPVFIMSVVGLTHIQPQGNFYGSIAGSVEVDLWPGTSVNYPSQGFGLLNFPGCTQGRYKYGISTWEITQL